MNTGFLYQF